MKVLIGVVVAVAVVAAIWFFGMSYTIDVGISPSAPLGDFAKLVKELTGKGLRADKPDPGEVQTLFRDRFEVTDDLTATSYVDLAPGLRHQVIVLRRPDGKIAAVLSHFRSGSLGFSKTGTKAENFAAMYWLLLAGGEPKFTKLNEGGGDAREYLLAKFDRAGASGQWRKEGASATLSIPQEISDLVVFAAK
jgi:hypothetical protein